MERAHRSARWSPWHLLATLAVMAGCVWFTHPVAAATPTVVLAPGAVGEASAAPAGALTSVPADGRLRGEDFTAEVTQVSWPQSVLAPSGIAYVAGSGRRLVAFALSVTQPSDDSGLLNAPTGVSASLKVAAASAPVTMTKIDQQIAGGTSGSANTTGTDSFVASVPVSTHDVSLTLSEAGFAQSLDLWTLERVPPSPTIVYRDPSSSSVTGTTSGAFHLSFTNPADGFSSSDDASVSSAQLSYFAPDGSGTTPGDPTQAFLVANLQSSFPSVPYGQPGSGAFFSGFVPLPGNRLTFTPSGGSAVSATASTAAFSSTDAASDDDGIFDSLYWFAVPATTTGGTLSVTAGPASGTEYTGFTGSGTTIPIDVTAAAGTTVTFPAVPAAPPAQKKPPWVGAPLPAAGLAAAPSAGSNTGSDTGSSHGGGFPFWAAALILVVVAAAVVVAQRWRHRRPVTAPSPTSAGPGSEPVVADHWPTDGPSDVRPVQVPPVAPLAPVFATTDFGPSDVGPTDVEPTEPRRTDAGLTDAGSSSGTELAANCMGRIEVVGVEEIDRSLEALLFFLAYHDGHHMSAEQILLAMRPNAGPEGDPSRKTMHNNLSKLRKLIGSEHLPDATVAGGYLIAGVGSDWATFRRLNRQADTVAGEQAMRLRTAALGLVRGRPFEGASSDLFEWVDEEHLRTDVAIAIARCAQRLGTDHLDAGELEAAEAAARSGLVGASDDYGLWDLGARAIDAREDRTALKRWMSDAVQHLDAADVTRIAAGLEHYRPPET